MKIVLKVPITCKKCKSCILQIVSKTKGIKSLTFDDEKSTLTVIGEVDVVVIVDKLRHPKKGKGKEKKKMEGYMVEVMAVSDEKKEAEEKKKKDEEEKKKKEKEKEEEEKKKKECAEKLKQCVELQQCCRACRPYYVAVDDHPATPAPSSDRATQI